MLVEGQAAAETTVNEALYWLDAASLGGLKVIDRDLSAPPGSPAQGDCYILGPAPSGAWAAGAEDDVALYFGTAWEIRTPTDGWEAWVVDEAVKIAFSSGSWGIIGTFDGADYIPSSYLDTDGTLAANSDAKIPSQKAVKTFVTAAVNGDVQLQGGTDCSANPNYPAASKGDLYYVTAAGKIGGASGKSVDIGDVYIANADNAGGTEASVGSSWFVLEHNLTSVISGSVASTTEQLTGTDATKVATPDSVAALWEQGSDVASSGTISLGEGGFFHVTGTTTITDIDFATDKAGRKAWIEFTGALTLTHNASTLILPTGANITTAAGDTACFISEGSDVVRCVSYLRASGQPLLPGVPAVTSQSGTSYTADLPDANTYIRFTNGSAISFTIPPNSSKAFPIGTVIEVEQAGAGALSFVAGAGVTLNSRASDLTLAGQYSVAFAKKVATDTWTINGDL